MDWLEQERPGPREWKEWRTATDKPTWGSWDVVLLVCDQVVLLLLVCILFGG